MNALYSIELVLALLALGSSCLLITHARIALLERIPKRTASTAALILASMALSVSYAWFTENPAPIFLFSLASLAFAVLMLLVIVVAHRFGMPRVRSKSGMFSHSAFCALLVHILCTAAVLASV